MSYMFKHVCNHNTEMLFILIENHTRKKNVIIISVLFNNKF